MRKGEGGRGEGGGGRWKEDEEGRQRWTEKPYFGKSAKCPKLSNRIVGIQGVYND